MRPRIALIPGDPGGIGPELIAKLLGDGATSANACVLLIGDDHVLALGEQQADMRYARTQCDPRVDDWSDLPGVAWLPTKTIEASEVRVAAVDAGHGRSVIATLDLALDLARDGAVDAVAFAPFNKAALHAGGLGYDDELHYMAARLGVQNYISELNTMDGIWTSRVTSHIALRDVADALTGQRICDAIGLIHKTLCDAGLARPRIAVAALNPHAGDAGRFGREEIEIIRPAVERMAAWDIAVDGPWPSDTVFLRATRGEIDAVVTMYHDQGQIALKLLGFDRGVTVQGGMPFPVTTPAHGTAFDIAGRGVADVGAMRHAFDLACRMAGGGEQPVH